MHLYPQAETPRLTSECTSSNSRNESSDSILPIMGSSVTSLSAVLPPWDEVMPIAELYLLYCDSQPLPLFHRSSFLASLPTRDVEIIYAVFALSLRFSDTYQNSGDLTEEINGYAEVARGLVMKRVSEGPVEVSTLQCLCLLSLVDFTSKRSSNGLYAQANKSSRWEYASLKHPQQSCYESSPVR